MQCFPLHAHYTFIHTIKFCCSGDQEYMTGTEATALRVFRGMICLGNSEKPLSTVHCTGQQNKAAVRTLCLTFTFSACQSAESNAIHQPLACLLRSQQTSWCEPAGFAWSSTPGSKCQFAPWFSDGWCWTCSGKVKILILTANVSASSQNMQWLDRMRSFDRSATYHCKNVTEWTRHQVSKDKNITLLPY